MVEPVGGPVESDGITYRLYLLHVVRNIVHHARYMGYFPEERVIRCQKNSTPCKLYRGTGLVFFPLKCHRRTKLQFLKVLSRPPCCYTFFQSLNPSRKDCSLCTGNLLLRELTASRSFFLQSISLDVGRGKSHRKRDWVSGQSVAK